MDSLVNQTIGLEHLQIMFIDDKSTDGSLDVIMPYIENYDSIEVYALDPKYGWRSRSQKCWDFKC